MRVKFVFYLGCNDEYYYKNRESERQRHMLINHLILFVQHSQPNTARAYTGWYYKATKSLGANKFIIHNLFDMPKSCAKLFISTEKKKKEKKIKMRKAKRGLKQKPIYIQKDSFHKVNAVVTALT